MSYYKICPNCKANLDPGERCDCETESAKLSSMTTKEVAISAFDKYRDTYARDPEGSCKPSPQPDHKPSHDPEKKLTAREEYEFHRRNYLSVYGEKSYNHYNNGGISNE